MESTVLLKKNRRVSMPSMMDRRVHFQRAVSQDSPEPAPTKKVLTRNNTVAGTKSTNQQVVPAAIQYSSVMDELVECPICYERLTVPKMLPCQHTFCQACLQALDKGKFLTCPTCALEVHLTPTVAELPTNLYLNSLLTALAQQEAASPQLAPTVAPTRCSNCQLVGKGPTCQHCQQVFCTVCWPKHVADLRIQLGSLSEQLQGAGDRLKHRAQDFKDQCEKLKEHIDEAVEVKIDAVRAQQKTLVDEAREIETKGEESANELQEKLLSAEDNISFLAFDQVTEASEKVNLFLLLHSMTANLLNEVSHWNESRPAFDRDTFRIHRLDEREGEEGGEEEAETFDLPKKQEEQISSPDGLSLHYRSRRFTTPRLTIDRSVLQRPAGVGVAPWSDSTIYIAGSDNRQVLVLDRLKGKLVSRLAAPDMLCPQGLAFSSQRIYVTDKWNHRIHVFDSSGAYVKAFGKKGNGEGMLRSPEGIATGPNPNVTENAADDEDVLLYVCDTGNDRLQVLRASDGSYVKTIGILRTVDDRGKIMTELNQPTGVAVTDHKIVVTDCGNRIRVYSLSGTKILEFGSHGGGRGQFRSPECVAIDRMGFILVGDSGNKRVQIFRPNGNLVQVIGGRSNGAWKFGWVSGLVIAENMDIIVTDCKNRSVHIF